MLKNVLLFCLIYAFVFSALPVLANDLPADLAELVESEEIVSEEAVVDYEVSESDLEVDEVKRLPSGFGSWWQAVKESVVVNFTFDPIEKQEKKLQYANERIVRAKYILENSDNERVQERALKEIEKADEFTEAVQERIDKLDGDSEKLQKFQDKFAKNLMQHHRILEKLEGKVPEHAFEKIEDARERRLDHLQGVFERLDENNQEKIADRMERVFESEEGSDFQPLSQLEFIESLKEKYPENKKEIFDRVIYFRHKNLKENLEDLPSDVRREKLENYAEFVPVEDPELKEELLERRHEVYNNLANSTAIDYSSKVDLRRANAKNNELTANNEAVIKGWADLEKKASAGDENAKQLIIELKKKIHEKERKHYEESKKIESEYHEMLPAYDETKWDPNKADFFDRKKFEKENGLDPLEETFAPEDAVDEPKKYPAKVKKKVKKEYKYKDDKIEFKKEVETKNSFGEAKEKLKFKLEFEEIKDRDDILPEPQEFESPEDDKDEFENKADDDKFNIEVMPSPQFSPKN